MAADVIERFKAELPGVQSIESVRIVEVQAAKVYWQSWADVPIRWPRKDGIVPALAGVPKVKIREALQVSEPYTTWIQNGIPHQRHWMALA